MKNLKKIFSQVFDFIKNLSPLKRVAIGGAIVFIFSAMVLLVVWGEKKTYVPLMTNLSVEDSTHIIRILRDKHIPFELDKTGKVISVPPENLYDFRLELAAMGLPQMSVVGYEIFDKQTLGTTSFVQKMNQKRALEGELMRTINTIHGIKRSRVHLVVPLQSAFLEEQKKPTASVVLDIDPVTVLTEKQIFGIGNLVAKAVEGLESADVLIMNSEGKVLSKNFTDPMIAATSSQLEYRQRLQLDLEKKIDNMLSRVVGEGRVAATVTADLDFSVINETQTHYDNDAAAIRSVEKRNDSMNGSRPSASGGAGANANNPTSANAEIKTETVKNNEITNYEIPQTVKKISNSIGAIKKLSIAVVVDGKQVKTKDEKGKVILKTDPWPADKILEFEQIVSSAVGLDKKRGDTLEIKNIDFVREDFEEAQRLIAEQQNKNYMMNILMYAVMGLGILLFFFVIVRPFMQWMIENTTENVDVFLPQTVEELEKLQKAASVPSIDEVLPDLPESLDPNKVEGEMIKERIIALVDTSPDKAALIIKDWLHHRDYDDVITVKAIKEGS